MLKIPVPLATSPPVAVFGFKAIPAFAPVAVRLDARLMLRVAVSVSRWSPAQVTGALMLTLPVPAGPVLLLTSVTLLLPNAVAKAVALMSPPVAATVISFALTRQSPLRPGAALERVVTTAASAILTLAADVVIEPPLPPTGALASSVPATFTVPDCMPPSSLITPPLFCSVCA